MSDNPYKSPDDRVSPAVFDPHSSPPRAKYTLAYPDLHRAFRTYMRRHRGLRFLINALVVAIAALAVIEALETDPSRRVGRIVFCVVFWVIALLLLNSRAFFYLVTSLVLLLIGGRQALGILGEHVIEVKDGELTESTQATRAAWKLSIIAKVDQAGNTVMITLPAGQFLCIPESADFGGDSFDTFYAKLKAAVDGAKKASTS